MLFFRTTILSFQPVHTLTNHSSQNALQLLFSHQNAQLLFSLPRMHNCYFISQNAQLLFSLPRMHECYFISQNAQLSFSLPRTHNYYFLFPECTTLLFSSQNAQLLFSLPRMHNNYYINFLRGKTIMIKDWIHPNQFLGDSLNHKIHFRLMHRRALLLEAIPKSALYPTSKRTRVMSIAWF